MTGVPLQYYLVVAGVLFTIGTVGFLLRRNLLILLMSIELMLNAANIVLVTFSRMWGNTDGQVLAMITIAVAAAEAAVGLAIVVSIFRARTGTDIDDLALLRD